MGWSGGTPELLAPAGSFEALEAAVGAGADAVYLAGRRFGARRYAGNFDDDGLARAIRFAHLSGVRVYVTANILVHDRELPDIARHFIHIWEEGADAILVQDAGVASLAREIVPDLPLHASTQLTIHNREGVKWAKDRGFSRVVLSRELPLQEISAIAGSPECRGMGLETFIHGALCFCYSGQCLLSSLIGGRSGNRGLCAQPCRKLYTLVRGVPDRYGRLSEARPVQGIPPYPLSTHDLSVYRRLDELGRVPLAALKIEGRMRSPRYVALVVDIYRRAIDAVGTGDFVPDTRDETALALAFTRGFTDGWILGSRQKTVLGGLRPDNTGVLVGTVASCDRRHRTILVRPAGTIVPGAGDGIAFIDPATGAVDGGLVAKDAAVRDRMILLPSEIRPAGTEVWLTSRAALTRTAAGISGRQRPPIPVDLGVSWHGTFPVLAGLVHGPSGKAVPVEYRAAAAMEPARGKALTEEGIRKQLEKTGGTRFAIRSLTLDYPGGLFAPPGYLNSLRREFLARAESAVLDMGRPSRDAVSSALQRQEAIFPGTGHPAGSVRLREGVPTPPQLSVYTDDPASVKAAADAGCRSIVFEPSPASCTHSCRRPRELPASAWLEPLADAAAACEAGGASLTWKWPRITRRPFLDTVLPALSAETGIAGIMLETPGAAEAIIRQMPGITLAGGPGLNVLNAASVKALSPPFRRLTLSPESTAGELTALVSGARDHDLALEIIVQGNLELGTSEECIVSRSAGPSGRGPLPCIHSDVYGLIDGSGRTFPFGIDAGCRTHIFNAVETCLIDRLPFIVSLGIGGIAIDARRRGPDYAGEMVGIYRDALALCSRPHDKQGEDLRILKKRAERISQGGITAGYLGSLREETAPEQQPRAE